MAGAPNSAAMWMQTSDSPGYFSQARLVDYFLQLTVVVPSLQAGETDGLSLFTQYDPHGLFIAMEALGYLMLTVALPPCPLYRKLCRGQRKCG